MMTSIHRIQAAGIEVMAGMIVGFDHDDAAIFEEQFRFIQEARIPISMTGMLNAVPRTALHERLREAGRLIAEHVGDQFVCTNIIPKRMTRLEFYQGYKRLLQRLYDYKNYRERAMALILNKGEFLQGKVLANSRDLGILFRFLWTCILRASPRRAAMTSRLMLATVFRRPRAFRHALSLALLHKHLYEYVDEISGHLDRLIDELRTVPEASLIPSSVPPSPAMK
jgi:hypothetical protein